MNAARDERVKHDLALDTLYAYQQEHDEKSMFAQCPCDLCREVDKLTQ